MGSSPSTQAFGSNLAAMTSYLAVLTISSSTTAFPEPTFPSDMNSVTTVLSVTYSCILRSDVTLTCLRDIVTKASRENNARGIGGKIAFRVARDHVEVDQTIEGLFCDIIRLFTRIRNDDRIDTVTHISYSVNAGRQFDSWGMVFCDNIYDTYGDSDDTSNSFMTQHTRNQVIHVNHGVSVVHITDKYTGIDYIMKEILIEPNEHSSANIKQKTEHDILTRLHERIEKNRTGDSGAENLIIRPPDVFKDDTRINYVFPLYQMDMFELINSYTNHTGACNLDPAICKIYFKQLVAAISTMERHGCIHRDIKLENICIQDNGNIALIDFGCSAFGTRTNIHGVFLNDNCLVGTPVYMAPETIQGMYSSKNDLWAAAMCVCELAANAYPYPIPIQNHRISPYEVRKIIVDNKPVKPPGMDESLWSGLKQVFVPHKNRPTASELLADSCFDNIPGHVECASCVEMDVVRTIVKSYGLTARGGKQYNREDTSVVSSPTISDSRRVFFSVA